MATEQRLAQHKADCRGVNRRIEHGASKIVFTSHTAAPVMTIHPDGKITLVDDAEPTEAAAACIEVMDGMIQNLIRNAVQKERNLIVSWCRNVNIDWCRCDDAIERGDHLKEELK